MDSSWAGMGVAMWLGIAVGAVLTLVVGGALLMLAVRWVCGFRPGYGRSCAVVFLALVLGTLLQAALAYLVRVTAAPLIGGGMGLSVALMLAGLAVSVLVTAVLVRVLMLRPDGSALPLGRALGAAAVYAGMGLVLYGMLLFAVFAVALGGLGGWR